jgi:hypothetical protein
MIMPGETKKQHHHDFYRIYLLMWEDFNNEGLFVEESVQ